MNLSNLKPAEGSTKIEKELAVVLVQAVAERRPVAIKVQVHALVTAAK